VLLPTIMFRLLMPDSAESFLVPAAISGSLRPGESVKYLRRPVTLPIILLLYLISPIPGIGPKSFYTGEPVSEIIGHNLGATLGIIALIMLMSLVMAGLLLTAGVFIGDIIKHPDWLVKIRGILRLVLVSSGAAVPAFVISAFVAVFIVKHQSSPYPTIPVLSLVFFCSLMPAWLLVQTGYRMLANRANTISLHLVQETSVRLCIRSLKMIGLIIVTTIIPNWFLAQRGLGANLIDYFGGRDFL